jgi:ABC-2 type transport system permease protein
MNFNQLQIALYTLVLKEIRRFMRIWPQTLLPPAITMSLYFVIFGNLVGSRIGQMGGFSYMQFIVPGLIMMAVITNSYANVSSSFFSAKFQKSIEELIMSSFLRSTRDHTVTQNDSINDKRSLRVAHGWNIRQYAAF